MESAGFSQLEGSVLDRNASQSFGGDSAAPIDGTAALRAGERAVAGLLALERAEAAVVLDLMVFDDAGLGAFLGFSSLGRYVAYETGRSSREAHRLVRLVRHCRRFPNTAAALASGDVTVPYLEVLVSAARGLAEEYVADEAELLELVDGRDVGTFERAVQTWRHRVEHVAGKADPERAFENRSVTMQRSFDGSGCGRFELDPLGMETLEQALETKPDSTSSIGPVRSLRQRRADALVDMAAHVVACESTGATGSGSGVDVVIDLRSLEGDHEAPVASIRQELASGTPISTAVLEQVLCDATFRRVVMDGPSVVLDFGTATRDVSPSLRRAIQRRDRHCQFAGCDTPGRWCDAHHLVPVSEGGPTSERNLALLCRFHHGLIHQAGWHLGRDPTTGEFVTSCP